MMHNHTLTDHRPTREFEGATRQREAAAARQAAKRASEQAIAAAHRAPGGGPRASVSIDKAGQDGTIRPGG